MRASAKSLRYTLYFILIEKWRSETTKKNELDPYRFIFVGAESEKPYE
jgi:hypothetical protein